MNLMLYKGNNKLYMKDINKILAKTHFKCKKKVKNPHFCENMSPSSSKTTKE